MPALTCTESSMNVSQFCVYFYSPVKLSAMYLDTTFCEPRAVYIPSRAESVEAALTVASDWLDRGPHYNVLLAHKAGLGYEQLYREMAHALSMKASLVLFCCRAGCPLTQW